MSGGRTEFCYKENRFFPAEEFFDDPQWGRVHRGNPPHTVTGDAVSGSPGGISGSFIDVVMDLPGDDGDDPVGF